jgi:hypothetical protein
MARKTRKTIVTLVDDLTREAAEDISTVEFGVDGIAYEPRPHHQEHRQRRGLRPRNAEIDPCVGQEQWAQCQRPRSTVRRGVAGLADRPGGHDPRISHALSSGRRWSNHK